MSETLRAYLLNTCRGLGMEPVHLAGDEAREDLLTALLKEAIRLRDEQQTEASLELLDAAEEAGMQSGWIADNRARALLMLERRAEALAIWETLAADGDDEGLRAMATQMAAQHRQDTADQDSSELTGELKAALDAAIALRESGQAEASLAMLEGCLEQGQRSPWLDDNRARALLALGRGEEAAAIWERLGASSDGAAAEAARSMLDLLERDRVQVLREQLQQLAAAAGKRLERVDAAEASRFADLERAVLEEAIQLRSDGAVELSLQLLEAAQTAGMQSPWLDDNRARALVILERQAEALAIWEGLAADGDDEVLRAMASEMAVRQRAALLESLWRDLNQVLESEGQPAQHLVDPAPESLADVELPLLKEAIGLRERGDTALSLRLLEAAVAGGLQSGWIDDNRARALVDLERFSDAVALWEPLLASEQAPLRDAAAAMLELYGERGRVQAVLADVEQALSDASSSEDGFDRAAQLLTDALVEHPGCEVFVTRLQELATSKTSNRNEPVEPGNDFPELRPHRMALAGFDAYLNALERRRLAASAAESQ
ncbi:hypothetical protein EVJ50_09400 [Synechococcus sp. RSCCF101]|uniref:hypothetical protein n=1 Tax=Synechococcus sp. RSCCF101 TaxID=2511069 RepID=UPI00124874E2|nr:hypothetical protein [Synechococcus sp. RSCCF101]QEY32396.1 hypothetical protein EVJ50_09400 [Synechococcus sp. RSCCF101]